MISAPINKRWPEDRVIQPAVSNAFLRPPFTLMIPGNRFRSRSERAHVNEPFQPRRSRRPDYVLRPSRVDILERALPHLADDAYQMDHCIGFFQSACQCSRVGHIASMHFDAEVSR